MPNLSFNGNTYHCAEDQSVLEALTGHGVPIPSSCRNGICQTCMMQAVSGELPTGSQNGLKETLKIQNYFLACSCHPQADMEVSLPAAGTARKQVVVQSIKPLNHEIISVGLYCENPIDYRAGQFINLFKDATLGRSYSLASVPAHDKHLTLHIRKVPDGRVSGWAHQNLKAGDIVEISAAAGNCFYVPDKMDQPILLIGTGSGLAPLYGIARDALEQGHTGPISLYHGSREARGLYLVNELRALADRHDNFSYIPCISGEPVTDAGYAQGRALDLALADTGKLTGWRVFICGNPDMVKIARKKAFLTGAAMQDIYADAFTLAVA